MSKTYAWKIPASKAEQEEILTLIEDRGDRVLVTSNQGQGLPITPTAVYSKSDLVEIKEKTYKFFRGMHEGESQASNNVIISNRYILTEESLRQGQY